MADLPTPEQWEAARIEFRRLRDEINRFQRAAPEAVDAIEAAFEKRIGEGNTPSILTRSGRKELAKIAAGAIQDGWRRIDSAPPGSDVQVDLWVVGDKYPVGWRVPNCTRARGDVWLDRDSRYVNRLRFYDDEGDECIAPGNDPQPEEKVRHVKDRTWVTHWMPPPAPPPSPSNAPTAEKAP